MDSSMANANENSWSIVKELPMFYEKEDGSTGKYTYEVVEDTIDGYLTIYEQSKDGYTFYITNYRTTSIMDGDSVVIDYGLPVVVDVMENDRIANDSELQGTLTGVTKINRDGETDGVNSEVYSQDAVTSKLWTDNEEDAASCIGNYGEEEILDTNSDNKKFYNAVTYEKKGDLIERRFLKSAKRLHRAVKVPNIFEKTTLPKVKSIRKLLFCNPALFFYTEELERLWEIIEDVNLFRNFITSQNIFSELAFLHKMPRLINFYAEYKAEIGIKRLYHHFFRATNRYWLYHYVSWYYLLSEYDKKIERQKWHNGWLEKRDDFEGIENDMGALFGVSIPDCSSKNFRHPDLECCINGYSFRRLKNSMEFLRAGKELKNCLADWQFFRNNVYGMIDNGKYVAAVEIKDNVIIQAHTYRNGDISDNCSIKQAFDVWKSRNSMTEQKQKGLRYAGEF